MGKTIDSRAPTADGDFERQVREVANAAPVSSAHVHELAEQSQNGNLALRESARRFREMIDALPAAIYTTDAHGRLTHFNPACVELSGRTPELGTDHWCVTWKLYYPDGRPMPHDQCPMAIALREGRVIRGAEAIAERPDGTRVWFTPYPTPLFDNAGNVIGGINMLVDITERKCAEMALRESEERFRTLFELGPMAVYSCDASGVIRTFNRRAAELWGREPAPGDTDERFCGSFRMIRPDGSVLAHEECPMAEVLCGKISHARDAEVRIDRPDGSRVTVVVNIRPLKNDQGQVIGAINCFYDITERKQAQEVTVRLAAIVTSSDDAIVSKDLNGIINSWNKGAEQIFGYTAEEVIGKPVTLLIPPDHLDEEPRILERIRRGEAIEHYETVRRRKDGQLLDISLTVSPIRDAAGRIIGASKIARDVTERKQLERRAHEKTTELAELHRRKDEFLAMLSHELRNPLAAISNAATLLRMDTAGESALQRQSRTVIERQLAQLVRLVDDLLEISRITTGRVQLRQERLSLASIVERAIEVVEPLVNQRQLALTLALPSDPIWVFGDAARLEQVVVNLLTNAAKYTEPHGSIWVGLDQAPEEAALRVRDTGVGIAPELLPRVFDLFTQGERTLDRSQGGLGIGLALVHRLVEMHGGKVEAHSSLGQGSEFVVRLPVMSPTQAALQGDVPVADKPAGPPLRVLVIEDNVDSARSLSMLLETAGHKVRMAHDGGLGGARQAISGRTWCC